MNTYEFLSTVLCEIAASAAQGAAYSSWSDAFARQDIRKVWNDINATLRRSRQRKVTIAELRAVETTQLHMLGFRTWDKNLTLIPLWVWNYIADGETLISIFGDTAVKGRNDIGFDVRGGCLAWGFLSLSTSHKEP